MGTLSVAESAAETVLFAQQLLLEKSLCTGKVFRKKPNTYILSASAQHSLGKQSFLKPLISAEPARVFGIQETGCSRTGGSGAARAAPQAEGGWGEMKIPAGACPVSLNSQH